MRYEKSALGKRSSNRRILTTPAWRYGLDGKHFEKGASRKKNDVTIATWSLVSLKTQIQNYRRVVWTESIWCLFSVKMSFSNFSRIVWTGLSGLWPITKDTDNPVNVGIYCFDITTITHGTIFSLINRRLTLRRGTVRDFVYKKWQKKLAHILLAQISFASSYLPW